MDKVKQQWTVEGTGCLLVISDEIQRKLEGASRTKPVSDKIQAEMALAGYERSVEQIINSRRTTGTKSETWVEAVMIGHEMTPISRYWTVYSAADRPATLPEL